MPFPTTRLIDKFNRADGALGTGWEAMTGFGATAPTIFEERVIGGDGYQGALRTTPTGADCEAHIKIPGAGDLSTFFGVLARVDADGNGYAAGFNPGVSAGLRVVRYDAFTPTVLGEEPWGTISDNDGVGIQCEGSTIRGLIYDSGQWLPIVSVPDATYSAGGKIGKHLFDPSGPTIALDDFGGGDMGIPGNVPVLATAPRIEGIAETGRTLTCNPGTYTGDATISFDFQWQRNNADLAGEETDEYTLVSDDEIQRVRCRVTAWNASGVLDAFTVAVEPIIDTSGMADTLVAVNGVWVPVKTRVAVGGEWLS